MAKEKIAPNKRRIPPGDKYKWPKNTELRMVGPKKDGDVEEKEMITPENQLEPPHLHGYSNAVEQSWFLRALDYSYATNRDDWHVMLDPIAFENEPQKRKWRNFHDARKFKCFSDWHRGPQYTNFWAQKLAVFNTWSTCWFKGQDSVWKRKAWNTWAAVLRPLGAVGGNRRDLFIYDSDWESVMEYRHLRTDEIRLHHHKDMQQRLVLYLTKGKGLEIRNIFIQGDPSAGNSTEKTGEFIRGLLTKGWKLPIPWDADSILSSWYQVRQYGIERPASLVASMSDKIDGFDKNWAEMPEVDDGETVVRVEIIQDETDDEWQRTRSEAGSDTEDPSFIGKPASKRSRKGLEREVSVDNSICSNEKADLNGYAGSQDQIGEQVDEQVDAPRFMSPLNQEAIDKATGWLDENIRMSVESETHRSPSPDLDLPLVSTTPVFGEIEKQLHDAERELRLAEIKRRENELAVKRRELKIRYQELDLDREAQEIDNMRLEDLKSRTLSLRATLERKSASRSSVLSGLSSPSRSNIRKQKPRLLVASAHNKARKVL